MVYFSIFKIKVGISVGFMGVITLMQYVDTTGLIIPTFFAVFLHELGHLGVMAVMGIAPKKIILRVGAANVEGEFSALGLKGLAVFIAGPLINLICFSLCYLIYYLTANPSFLKNSAVMLTVGIFNLIPAKGLDGGSILLCILTRVLDIKRTELFLKIISLFVSVFILCFGIWTAIKSNNPSPVIMGVYLLSLSLLKKSQTNIEIC